MTCPMMGPMTQRALLLRATAIALCAGMAKSFSLMNGINVVDVRSGKTVDLGARIAQSSKDPQFPWSNLDANSVLSNLFSAGDADSGPVDVICVRTMRYDWGGLGSSSAELCGDEPLLVATEWVTR